MINKSGLILRLAVVVIFTALAVGTVVSQIFFRITYVSELEASQVKISQLFNTVSATSSIATYLEDTELINEVIAGLNSNDIINSVAIKTNTINAQSQEHTVTESSQVFTLYSPFEADREVGSMVITPNIKAIERRASKISWDNQIAILIQAAIVTVTVIVISYIVVTLPISQIAGRLHKITPGTTERIDTPRYHRNSELGMLTEDINMLLDKSSKQIVEERDLRQQVEKLSKHFKLLFENSNSPIVLTEPNGNIVLYNQAFILLLEKLGTSLHQNFGPYLRDLFEDIPKLDSLVEDAFNNSEFASGEFKLKQQGDNTTWVQAVINLTVTDNFHEYYQVTLHDISLRRQQLEQLNVKAYTDKLTRLVNRRGAEQQAAHIIDKQVPFALLLIDLNHFKPINDVFGHDIGDHVLKYVATQLTKCMRKQDLLSRWGGDEFLIILPQQGASEVSHICQKIKSHIEKPLFIDDIGESVSVGASIGVSFYPEEKTDLASLVKAADQAMYSLKADRENEKYLAFYSELS